MDIAERADIERTAHALADAARRAILPHFRTAGLGAENKDAAGFDPVTAADRTAELAMREVLATFRPDDGIVGEEFGESPGRSGVTWVIDPIDGTRGFLSGTPTWTVLVAATVAGRAVFGVVDQPYIGERFWGGFGKAGFDGPQGAGPLATRPPRPLSEAILFSTFPEIGTAEERARFDALSRAVRLTRFGLDGYAYALVALGQIDLVVEAGLHAHDVQAPIAVIEAAGGIVTTWDGGPAGGGGRILAAANREIHAAAMRILGG